MIEFEELKPTQMSQVENIAPTKSNIQPAADILSAAVKEGHIDVIEFAVKMKFMQEVLDAAYKSIMPDLLAKVDKKTTYLGAALEVAETGVKYDYTQDAQWTDLNVMAKPLLAQIKAREEQLKMATKIGANLVDNDGEVIAEPVLKTSTTSVKVTLGK